jgi:hypothetical protein
MKKKKKHTFALIVMRKNGYKRRTKELVMEAGYEKMQPD